jgi:ArsR family transcriptional regulator, arsenate/arsenite/antimonite-responsive transcriptional repressor
MTRTRARRGSLPPFIERPLAKADATRLSSAFKVLGDPARLRLLSLIGSHPNGEVCACDLVTPIGLSQPTVSHHLKVLHEAGFLERERRGTWIYYRVATDRLSRLAERLYAGGS